METIGPNTQIEREKYYEWQASLVFKLYSIGEWEKFGYLRYSQRKEFNDLNQPTIGIGGGLGRRRRRRGCQSMNFQGKNKNLKL